ncbi:MAG TPA: GH25 family lysozyme [Kofleriaceae bacterium]
MLAACSAEQAAESVDLSTTESALSACGKGPTVKGVDVSSYQADIDWSAVKGDGVKYAFIRASDGLNSIDSKFERNWSMSRAEGITHGVYQYFRPNQDPIAQADLLLDKIGGMVAADELPPVIDIEATGSLAPADVAAKAKLWVDHVKAATGVTPIVYTGFYFWRDMVGAPSWGGEHPLWHAQYTSAACANIASPWTAWAFWQYSSSGTVAGIPGPVDMDRFDGTEAELATLTAGGGGGGPDCLLPLEGGAVDDGDACFASGGPAASMRHVTDAGNNGTLQWTHTTADASEANYAQWNFALPEAGRYTVEVYTSAAYAQSKQAKYVVHASGADQMVSLDQTAVDGWQTLGDFDLAAGGEQYVHLGDNTGEALSSNVQLVFDAVRITRIEDGSGSGDDEPKKSDDGCSAGGSPSVLLGVGLIGLVRRRRRA